MATLAMVKVESRGSADSIVKKVVLALTRRGFGGCLIARARCLTTAYLLVAQLYSAGRRRARRGRRRGARQERHRAETELAYDDASNEAAHAMAKGVVPRMPHRAGRMPHGRVSGGRALYPSGRRRALRGRERGPRQGLHRAETELAYERRVDRSGL